MSTLDDRPRPRGRWQWFVFAAGLFVGLTSLACRHVAGRLLRSVRYVDAVERYFWLALMFIAITFVSFLVTYKWL
jgi:hypothetical protein